MPRDPWCRCWPRAGAAAAHRLQRASASAATRAARDMRGRSAGQRQCRADCAVPRAVSLFAATSQRLMNSEATEATSGDLPAAMRRSMPRRYASAAATYCSRENSSVTLIGTPAKIDSSIAGMPSGVPGILTKRFSRSAALMNVASPQRSIRRCRLRAAARLPSIPSRRHVRVAFEYRAGTDRRHDASRRVRAR